MKKITLILCLCVAISAYAQNIVRCGTVTDYDGNVYQTVKIGTQCWMAENLRTTHYADGTEIAMGGNNLSYDTPYRYYPNSEAKNVSTYGYLYNWVAVMGGGASSDAVPSNVQGVCPKGWHVPSYAEWNIMLDDVDSHSLYQFVDEHGKSRKSLAKALASTTGWEESKKKYTPGYNSQDNNTTGFSAMPAGDFCGFYNGFSTNVYSWTATDHDDIWAYLILIWKGSSNVTRGGSNLAWDNKQNALTVRCIRGSGELDVEEFASRIKAFAERQARKARTVEDLQSGFSFLSGIFNTASVIYLNTLASSYPTTYNAGTNTGTSDYSSESSSTSGSSVSQYVTTGTATGVKITESGSVSSISCPIEKWNGSGAPAALIDGEHYVLGRNTTSSCNGVSVSQYSYVCHVTHGSRILYTVFVNF